MFRCDPKSPLTNSDSTTALSSRSRSLALLPPPRLLPSPIPRRRPPIHTPLTLLSSSCCRPASRPTESVHSQDWGQGKRHSYRISPALPSLSLSLSLKLFLLTPPQLPQRSSSRRRLGCAVYILVASANCQQLCHYTLHVRAATSVSSQSPLAILTKHPSRSNYEVTMRTASPL